MKIVLLNIASANEEWSRLAEALYTKKINHFIKFEVIGLKPKKMGREASSRKTEEESQMILNYLEKEDFVVLFDATGKSLDSKEFAKMTERILSSGKKRSVWILGGAYGVTSAVKERADVKINLAPFVLNHLVAQTVVLEQLYRSFTILKGLPYHNI